MSNQAREISGTRFRAKLAGTLLVLALLCAFAIMGITRHTKQTASQVTYIQLPMMHGNDVRRGSVGLDQMYDICVKRLTQESLDCRKAHIPPNEAIKRMDAVHAAGQAEIDRVVASHYAETFDPTVMDKAAQVASKTASQAR